VAVTDKTWIDRAGKFKVAHLPCPHSNQPVLHGIPRTGVLHTTEGGWRGAFGVFRTHYAPHFLVGYDEHKNPSIAQLIPVGIMASTTRAHNNMAIVQIEFAGYSEEKLWLPDPPTLDALCSLMNVCQREWGIPLEHPWEDGDFGLAGSSIRNSHRRSGKFGHIAGWYGHGDLPDPDVHWDPGALEWSKVFAQCERLEAEGTGV
jgi:hypothetical protein